MKMRACVCQVRSNPIQTEICIQYTVDTVHSSSSSSSKLGAYFVSMRDKSHSPSLSFSVVQSVEAYPYCETAKPSSMAQSVDPSQMMTLTWFSPVFSLRSSAGQSSKTERATAAVAAAAAGQARGLHRRIRSVVEAIQCVEGQGQSTLAQRTKRTQSDSGVEFGSDSSPKRGDHVGAAT